MNFILYIRGGLGNQLFQYATMRYLHSLHPGSVMYIDRRGYQNYKVRDFELDSFKLIDKTRDYQESPMKYELSRKGYHLYQYLYQKATGWQAPMLGKMFQKQGLIYATIDYVLPQVLSESNNYLYGYFAKFEYIDSIREELVGEVKLKHEMSDKAKLYSQHIAESICPVGVSVRYGKDYQSLGWPICQPAYYYSAIKKIHDKFGKCKFFIFCDVIDEVKSEGWFKDFDVEYVEGCSVPESFTLLKSCTHFVIPNSSFAVWAAYLSDNPFKIVYAPNYFYTERYGHRYDRIMHFKGEKFLDYRTGSETEDI